MRRALVATSILAAGACVALACGDRTGLLVDSELPEEASDAAAIDAAHDAPSLDASYDASFDALPPIDAAHRDAKVSSDCPDADATLVYVVTQENGLYSFYPPTASFRFIGTIACPASGGATPWSMAVDRRGIAYTVFSNGELFRVSTATAACQKTPYVPGQGGFSTFGMGFVADTNDPGETLFVAESSYNQPASKGLATIDTKTFTWSFVGPFTPSIPRAELTGTSDGRLFAYSTNASGSGSHIDEIDKTSGRILGSNALSVGDSTSAFAFAYWGGDFWVFTSPGGASQVTRYRLSDSSETTVTSMPATIVGAGVSTCAPSP